MEGLKPLKDPTQIENFKYLQSLKFIQKFDDSPEQVTLDLRERNYSDFRKDPTGEEYMEELDKIANSHQVDPFVERIKFIEKSK
jgi:hypothetical protein